MLSITPSIKIVATILARNEADIIGPMIEHHLSQGVWKIILTDNASSDDTRQIAARYPEVIEIIDEADNTHNQSAWVTRMARLACKLNPDWIVHLDADEFWCGLQSLRDSIGDSVASECMYLHPPAANKFDLFEMRHYVDFDRVAIPQELKVAHRPDPEIEIIHGNHGIIGRAVPTTRRIWRHHYPIRSAKQWQRKSAGHLNLQRRNSTCERWENWYTMLAGSQEEQQFQLLLDLWTQFRQCPSKELLLSLLNYWATPAMIQFFKDHPDLPEIRQWPPENRCVTKLY